MNPPTKAFVISHSHWDREWYLPFRLFQNKLVILMDYLLDIIENEPSYTTFVADCQVAMIDDYLAVKPSATGAIKAALAAGRILAGPYYVPPNEWLINGEAYVRNLVLARRVLNQLGLPAPNCTAGYSPDSACSDFGHPLQVPQIWRLFGLPFFVARGLGGKPGGGGFPSDFNWEAPDGSRVHLVSLVAGYSSVADLSEDVDRGVAALLKAARELEPKYLTRNMLLFNGNDHLLPQKHIGHLIARANAIQQEFVFQQSSYEAYGASVEQEMASAGREMLVYKGEFMEHGSREAEGKMRKVNGFFSTRVYLKQANARCEQLLAGHAEPLSTLAWIAGGHDFPGTHLWEAWTWVARNHHHDSVPGTSTDDVNRECASRYVTAEQIATGIAVKKLNEIAQHVPGLPPGLAENNDSEEACIIAFNPHPWPYRGPVTFNLMDNWLYCAEPSVRLIPLCAAMTLAAPPAFYITDMAGHDAGVVKDPIPNDTGYKFNTGVTNGTLSFVSTLPACGYKVFTLHPDVKSRASRDSDLHVDASANVMENACLRVSVLSDGRVTVRDKIGNREHAGLFEIVDYGDRGDEYDQAPVKDAGSPSGWSLVSSIEATPRVRWVETASPRGRVDIEHVLLLPRRLVAENRTDRSKTVTLPVTVSLRLYEQANRLDVTVTVENTATDHRVELRVPSGILAGSIQVDGTFCTSTRAAHIFQTACAHRFVDVNDGKAGIAIATRGIHEYNLAKDKDGTLVVDFTLLRCIGVLAGHHIGNHWPANSVPGAQCKGTTICELALLCHGKDAVEGNVHRFASEFCNPPRAIEPLEHLYLRGKCTKVLPAGEHSFISMSPAQLEMSSFCKDEHRDVACLRLYNVARAPCKAEIDVGFPVPVVGVTLVDLKGDPLPDQQFLHHVGNRITFDVKPAQIVTLAMKFGER